MKLAHVALLIAATTAFPSHAATSINLAGYQVAGIYSLDVLGDTTPVSGLEASAVTYARDRNSLFFVGDEGTGVIEISLTGQTLGTMAFSWAGTASTNNDTEALAYLGGGVLVVGEERLFDAYRFTYSAGGTATLADSYVSISNDVVGNNGFEGMSYDPRDGSFLAVKQQSPQDILAGGLTFSGGAGGTATMANLFNPALIGVASLSDVQTLSPIDALAGSAAADNLLFLSLGSRLLVETDRLGNVLSSFDLSTLLPSNAFEGVTVDEHGNIYIVAEQAQDGSELDAQSKLVVLSPVPEPETYALTLAGLGLLGLFLRRGSASSRRVR